MIFERIFNDDDFDRINNMVRWNGWRRINDESVGHHTFIVVWFTRLLCQEIWGNSNNELTLEIVTKAIFHDFDEMFTGDILHTVKHNHENADKIRELLDKYVVSASERKFSADTASGVLMNDNIMLVSRSVTKSVVKLADWLSMLYYLKREIDMGNKDLRRVHRYCNEKLSQYCDESIDPILKFEGDTTIIKQIKTWLHQTA